MRKRRKILIDLKGRDYLEAAGLDLRMILKLIIGKYGLD
jgi:hypothetical protein